MSKIIHQIWLQGEDKLPLNLHEFKISVIENNLDFEIKYWDYDEITSFIRNKRQDWVDKWNLIIDEDQSFVKLTEIARWLILYEYGGFYLDRDVMVYKPLNTLYDILQPLKTVCIASEKVIKDRYMQIPIGYKSYSTVKKRFEYVLQDSFVFSNPKNNFFSEFLDYGFELRHKNVFESFSIWALTDFVNKFKKSIFLLEECDVLHGNESDGYSSHYFVNGWLNNTDDRPWESTNSELKNFNLYKI